MLTYQHNIVISLLLCRLGRGPALAILGGHAGRRQSIPGCAYLAWQRRRVIIPEASTGRVAETEQEHMTYSESDT